MASVSRKKAIKKEEKTLTKIISISHHLRKHRKMRFIFHKMDVVTSIVEDDDVKMLKHASYYLYSLKYNKPKVILDSDRKPRTVASVGTLRNIPINATFIDYTYNLSRLANRFLWYLLTYEVDYSTNQFMFNKKTKHDWKGYCMIRELADEESMYSERSLQNTMTELKDNNIVINIRKSVYMINPMLVFKGGFYEQNKMVNQYAELIINKGKEVTSLLTPTTSLSV